MPPVVLTDALDAALSGRFEAASAALGQLDDRTPGERSRRRALSAVAAGIAGHHGPAVRLANRAVAEAPDASAATIALAISCFVHSFAPRAEVAGRAPGLFDELWERRDTLLALRGEDGAVAGYVSMEAAMAVGRLADAQFLAERYLEREWSSSQGPVFARIALARSLVFQGQLVEAKEAAAAATLVAIEEPARVLAASTSAYIAAQLDQREETERLTVIVENADPSFSAYTVGSRVLCAYALGAVESVPRAAALILQAGGGPALPQLLAVDRAYGYELLASAAIERGDLAAAREWGRRALPLQVHDMAAAAVGRTLSRIDVAMGESASGAERASVAAARALVAGGRIDAARSEVLFAAALAASGSTADAAASLRGTAHDAEQLGALAVRSWSARELRRLGRRIRPMAGEGWLSLSQREQQIALLAAEGFTNRMIAQALFLSERTVQSHLSRALAALGASSRAAIPASLGRGAAPASDLPPLTTRQQQVAVLVAEGQSNQAISGELAISEKTVEKHVQGIFSRWGVTSRTGIANRMLGSRPDGGAP